MKPHHFSSLSALALLLATAGAARAHWITGFVYCDDGDGVIDAADTPINGVEVKATSLTTNQMYFDTSGDQVPSTPPTSPGRYWMYVAITTDNYDVQLDGVGMPPGASVIVPASGHYTESIVDGNPATDHVTGVNFLLANCQPKCVPNGCDDSNVCTTDTCNPATGCQHTSVCLFTRTPGFYKNHPTITQAILDAAGGVDVCGEHITNTATDDAHSALEALCVAIQGTTKLQLARELMAAALNGASGGNVFGNYALCNAVCTNPSATQAQVTQCINSIDKYNNAGDNLSDPFDTGGGADPNSCRGAAATACVIPTPSLCTIQ